MKKIAILVSIVMMTVMLVGCGSNDKNVNDNNTTKKEASKDTTDKQEKNTDTKKEETSKDNDEKSSSNDSQNNEVNSSTEIDLNEAAGVQAALDKLEAFNGEVDEQTGNTFSYGYEGIVNIDGEDYYNFRTSWLVSEEGGSSHLSYLTNYVVSKDLSKVAQYYDGQLYFN